MYRCLLVAFCLVFSIQSFANVKADQAALAYAERDYDDAGVKKAQEAEALYGEAVLAEAVELAKLNLMLDQASANYFLGTALSKKSERKAAHQKAMDLADSILTSLGVAPDKAHELTQDQANALLNKLDADQELVVAEAMYSKGISLAQWGKLNGISSSIGKLPTVLGLMERIEMLGYESIHQYGPYRTIGRVNFVLPKIFKGDIAKSEKFLKDAYSKSLAEGQKYSINGYNNIYLAETMYKLGKETGAKKLLDTFLAADIGTLAEGSEPENREAMRVAQNLADDWK